MPTPSPTPAPVGPNPHLVGLGNLLVPGLGEGLNGNWLTAAGKASFEIGTFFTGYELADEKGIASLDGIRETYVPFTRRKRGTTSIEGQMYSNMLLEVSFKTHMTNTFLAYRDAWAARGVTEGLDQHTFFSGFEMPFESKNLTNPWVYVPLLLVTGGLVADYFMTERVDGQRLNPSSNFLFASHYGILEPIGSGWPEEAFYRGYLQHEVTLATGAPALAIVAQAAAFALSHEAGAGQVSAFMVGTYLGYLAERFHGDLGPGVTLHFWGGLFLGIETILVSHRNQKSTPPTALGVQFTY